MSLEPPGWVDEFECAKAIPLKIQIIDYYGGNIFTQKDTCIHYHCTMESLVVKVHKTFSSSFCKDNVLNLQMTTKSTLHTPMGWAWVLCVDNLKQPSDKWVTLHQRHHVWGTSEHQILKQLRTTQDLRPWSLGARLMTLLEVLTERWTSYSQCILCLRWRWQQ